MIPQKILSELAQQPGTVVFKTAARKDTHPYELLHFPHDAMVIVPFLRTAKSMHVHLAQHGLQTKKIHYIDLIAKTIQSPFEQKNTVYAQDIDLNELAQLIEKKVATVPKGTRYMVLDSMHALANHFSDKETITFLDHVMKRMDIQRAKLVILADYKKLPKTVKRFLFTRAEKVLETI